MTKINKESVLYVSQEILLGLVIGFIAGSVLVGTLYYLKKAVELFICSFINFYPMY